jgi:hypothetical protein
LLDQGEGMISISQYVNHMIRAQFEKPAWHHNPIGLFRLPPKFFNNTKVCTLQVYNIS